MTRSLSAMIERFILHHVIGRKPTAAFANAHRAARQVDPDPNVGGALHLVIEPGASPGHK